MIDGCYQWKVARINSKSSSSTSTIIEYFGMSYMNFDVVDYELRFIIARKGRKLRETVLRIFTAYRGISRVRLARFEQRWNEDESSSVHRETVAFTMWVNPQLPRKSAAAAAAILRQYIRGQSLIAEKRTEFGLWFLDDRRGEDITRDSHLQVCLLRHRDRRHSEAARTTYWAVLLPVWRTEKCTKSQNYLEREFTCKHWSHCLYRRSFKSVKWAIFVQSEDHKRIIPPRMMNYAKIPCKSTIHLYRGSSTRSLLCCRSERRCWGDVHTRTGGRQTFLPQWEGGVQFISTTMPAKQK